MLELAQDKGRHHLPTPSEDCEQKTARGLASSRSKSHKRWSGRLLPLRRTLDGRRSGKQSQDSYFVKDGPRQPLPVPHKRQHYGENNVVPLPG